MSSVSAARQGRASRKIVTTVGLSAAALSLAFTGSAVARGGGAVPPPPTSPTSASQIQNLDQVRTAIKAYYGDTETSTTDPVAGNQTLHTFAPAGAYATEVQGIASTAGSDLTKAAKGAKFTGTPAIVLDVDDTTLNTYNYEIYSNFTYNPTTNAAFVNSAAFPAVPGMVQLEHLAESKGYTVFFLTGRPVTQHDGTVANLTDVGYDVTDANLYLKDKSGVTMPWLSGCAPTCTTVQYKSLTRAHIESLGYDIVANFGDQQSDLTGGYADRTYKLPNPMYYLP